MTNKTNTPDPSDTLYNLAEAAYTETVEYILGDLEDTLDDHIEELAKTVAEFPGEDKSECPALEQSKQIIKGHVEDLCAAEKLAIQYFHVENDAGLLSDDEIVYAILYNWIDALIEFNQELEEDKK